MKVLRLVASKVNFSRADWMQAIQMRVAFIRSQFDSFTLIKLSQAEMCIPAMSFTTLEQLRRRGKEIQLVLPEGYGDSDIQGVVFRYAKKYAGVPVERSDRDCSLYSWGLIRNGAWVLIRSDLVYQKNERWDEFHLEKMTVSVSLVDLDTMLTFSGEDPERVCGCLSALVYGWERKRQELLTEIGRFASTIQEEDVILSRLAPLSYSIHWPQRGPLPEKG